MEGKRLIEKIRLRNILSFGDKGEEIELQPLNIIIGQNASGKSNLVDVIKLLRSLPQEKGLVSFISKSGGIYEWIWKGKNSDEIAEIDVMIWVSFHFTVHYAIDFMSRDSQRLYILEELLEFFHKSSKTKETYTFKRSDVLSHGEKSETPIWLNSESLMPPQLDSIYGNFKEKFLNITSFTDLQTNRSCEIRKPQVPDAPNEFLEEDGSNLSLVLNDLELRGNTKEKIIENLKKFYPQVKDYSVRILGGTVQLFIREEGLEKPISAMRLSDGTLRYLCLLAILCHPEPPPLICIEEPETGLHPDILPTIAELMKEASQRTQLIVTTHSDILVSAFSDMPEAVLVCEKDEDGTHFKRLEADKLKEWLEEYELGDLWIKGEIGGKRW